MTTTQAIWKGQVRTVEDAVEAWKAQSDEAEEVRKLEAIVSLGIQLADVLAEWYKDAWEDAFSGRLRRLQDTGEALRSACTTTQKAITLLRDQVKIAEGRGFEVDRSADLDKAEHMVERLRADLEARWPFFDPKQIEESRAQLARGEGQDVEDILRELQGPGHPQG